MKNGRKLDEIHKLASSTQIITEAMYKALMGSIDPDGKVTEGYFTKADNLKKDIRSLQGTLRWVKRWLGTVTGGLLIALIARLVFG